MANMKIKGVEIVETFAEAFPMVGTRIIITAPTQKWALIAAQTMTGFATSVIACGAEAGIERLVPAWPKDRGKESGLHFAEPDVAVGDGERSAAPIAGGPGIGAG